MGYIAAKQPAPRAVRAQQVKWPTNTHQTRQRRNPARIHYLTRGVVLAELRAQNFHTFGKDDNFMREQALPVKCLCGHVKLGKRHLFLNQIQCAYNSQSMQLYRTTKLVNATLQT